jgi:mRNA-degrading endonuclease RelE of RelBE toxin-antitoxin system
VYYVKQMPTANVAGPRDAASQPRTVYQLNFSDQALAELKKLPKMEQLELMEQMSMIHPEELARGTEHMGKFSRDGKTYYRLRAGEFRIYFEVTGESLFMHYILHKHSLADFEFRFKLAFTEKP